VYYSGRGFYVAFRESAFQQEFISALILLPLACWLDVSTTERVLLIFSVVFVLIVEILNTAVEAVVDRVGFEEHELAGQAKDLGSAAVLLSIITWAVVWLIILYANYSHLLFAQA
jgi:diacylglycerol kinase (ATP)